MLRTLTENPREHRVLISTDAVKLEGNLVIPSTAKGIVIFAHGSGSSRHSRRNKFVAQVLQEAGLATLLIDLLTPAEEIIDMRTRHFRFDLGLLATRLMGATNWLAKNPDTSSLRVGYFGASTGAGAALLAAADCPETVVAIVSRSGRPDLVGSALTRVQAPTLLIVGGDDLPIIAMNEDAFAQIRGEKQLKFIPGATHLFEEPGALEKVARLATRWFTRYLTEF